MRWKEILNEGVVDRYLPMFTGLFALSPDPEYQKKHIIEVIKGHADVHKRHDRIVYFLRWYRFSMVVNSVIAPMGTVKQDLSDAEQRVFYDACRGVGLNKPSPFQAKQIALLWNRDWNRKLLHFEGTPCAAIQQFSWGREHPEELITNFTEMETEWRGGLSGVVDKKVYGADDYRPEPTVFLQIDHEWAWYNLNIDACEIEGEAMGHCGNEQNRREDDTLLSLRREVDEQTVRPSLTFILHSNGYLGEMKGRGNKKPHAKYHPAIYNLLTDPRIHGIEGGGYDPENNFSIFDLPQAEAQALLEQKPDMAPLADFARFYTETKTDWVKPLLDKMVEEQFDSEDIDGVNPEEDRIDISTYPLRDWLGHIADTAPSYLFRSFWNELGFSTEHSLFTGFLRALVPFDKSFALECVQCDLTRSDLVTTYLPYSGLPMAMQENIEQWDDGGAPLLYQCHDTIDDWDGEAPNWNHYCDAIDYSVVGLPKEIAMQAIDAACNPQSSQEDRLAAGRVLQRRMSNP
jgi:hypothetical protein